MNRQEKLLSLADRIDHEKLWQLPAMHHDTLTQDQRDRMDAAVELRRFADILGPGRWLVIPPTGPMRFSAYTLDKAYEMAKKDDDRKAGPEQAVTPELRAFLDFNASPKFLFPSIRRFRAWQREVCRLLNIPPQPHHADDYGIEQKDKE